MSMSMSMSMSMGMGMGMGMGMILLLLLLPCRGGGICRCRSGVRWWRGRGWVLGWGSGRHVFGGSV